jgi:hypothetical protein
MFVLSINLDFSEYTNAFDAINALAHHIKANPNWEQDRLMIFDEEKGTDIGRKNINNEFVFKDKRHNHWMIDCLLNNFSLPE